MCLKALLLVKPGILDAELPQQCCSSLLQPASTRAACRSAQRRWPAAEHAGGPCAGHPQAAARACSLARRSNPRLLLHPRNLARLLRAQLQPPLLSPADAQPCRRPHSLTPQPLLTPLLPAACRHAARTFSPFDRALAHADLATFKPNSRVSSLYKVGGCSWRVRG
jgi:hypothetical protein